MKVARGWWRCGDYFLHGPGDDLYALLFMAIDDAELRGWLR